MAAASIDGINIKIGADLSDLKEEMGAATDAIKGVGTAAETDIKKASGTVDTLKESFKKTGISAERLAGYCRTIAKTIGEFTSGVIEEALKVSPETAEAWESVKTSFQSLKETFAEAFAPVIQEIAPVLTDLLNKLATFIQENPEVAQDIMGLAFAVGIVASVLSAAAPLAVAFGVSISTIMGPVLAVIAVIIIVIYVIMNWGDICEWFKARWEELKTAFNTAVDAMKTKIDEWKQKFNSFKAYMITFKNDIVAKVTGIKDSFVDAITGIDLIQKGKDFVSNFAAGIKAEIESIRSSVHEWFMSLIPDGLENLFSSTTANSTAATAADPMGVFGHRAGGGSVVAGNPYIVGEVGPELFVPHTSGTIIPNDELREYGPSVNVTIEGSVYGEAYLRDYVAETMAAAIHRQMRLA